MGLPAKSKTRQSRRGLRGISGVPDDTRRIRRAETLSGIPLDLVYGPEGAGLGLPPPRIGRPGHYPFTRGIHEDMYRGRLWTMRMFAGFGSPEDTNRRFRFLLDKGQTGLSTAFDMPTLMGYDPDDPRAAGEVGVEGVSVASVQDMARLFEGIPLDRVTTSMTINAPAVVMLAFYVAAAESQGIEAGRLRGTLQNDILKEFIAQKEWISPVGPSMRIIRDMLVWCTQHMPEWNTISISGYHIREAGADAVQELAFTLADGIAYVRTGIEAGLDVDRFGRRLSFFFDVHNDFFEEIAKLRAARRMWARIMKERFGARSEAAMRLRTHAQTAGVSLTAQQPLNNVARVAIQALAAVLGGTQSLHTNSMDETYALPTEEAATVALRTQQVIAFESGAARVVDPLGGSWFVEKLTDEIEKRAQTLLDRIDAMGGMVRAIEAGYPQTEIADTAYEHQRRLETGDEVMIGVNRFAEGEEQVSIPLRGTDPSVERCQRDRVRELRRRRDAAAVRSALEAVRDAAASERENLVPPILEAVRSLATLGEICAVFRRVFGEYRDPGYY
ncbi:MAG: methylmalonyl-CoA mutase family protein [bacterium]